MHVTVAATILGRSVGFWFHWLSILWMLCVIDCHGERNGHHAECLGLEKLHRCPNVFFHQLCDLSFCAIRWPLFPNLLFASTITCFPLTKSKEDPNHQPIDTEKDIQIIFSSHNTVIRERNKARYIIATWGYARRQKLGFEAGLRHMPMVKHTKKDPRDSDGKSRKYGWYTSSSCCIVKMKLFVGLNCRPQWLSLKARSRNGSWWHKKTYHKMSKTHDWNKMMNGLCLSTPFQERARENFNKRNMYVNGKFLKAFTKERNNQNVCLCPDNRIHSIFEPNLSLVAILTK